ncbi:MAG: HEAT repeat domain-containing protein [Candidatus Omnitrophica bacterium]|nr:HEAT repeat domain-containing protein [Candidatus Omnitrophota bacterium]
MPVYSAPWQKSEVVLPKNTPASQTLNTPLQKQIILPIPFADAVQKIIAFVVKLSGEVLDTATHNINLSPADEVSQDSVEKIQLRSDTDIPAGDIDDLIKQLDDPDPDKRIAAAKRLGESQDPAVIQALIDHIGDPIREVRVAIADALSQIGSPAVRPLINALTTPDPIAREAMKWALVKIGEVGPLVEGLSSPDMLIRAYCAGALEEIGAPAVNELIPALYSPEWEVRRLASWTLSKIGEPAIQPLIDELDTTNPDAKKAMVEALGWIGEPAISSLIDAARDNPNAGTRETCAEVLISLGEPAMRQILDDLGLPKISGDFSYQRAAQLLVTALGDRDPSKRDMATLILAKLGEPAIPYLMQAIWHPFRCAGARNALIMMGEPAFMPSVTMLLDSGNPYLNYQGKLIIEGIAQRTGYSLDPSIDIWLMRYKGQQDLKNIILTNTHPATRALALYFLGTHYNADDFIRQYIFDETPDGLTVRNTAINEFEMAAILWTGIPERDGWWGQLASRQDRIAYLEIMLRGDFTDHRIYILRQGEQLERAWVCVQYAEQLIMNFLGYDASLFADKDAFQNYGAGYVIPAQGYGVPAYFAITMPRDDIAITTASFGPGHAFIAIFIGDGPIDDDPQNWIFIEPQNDSFTPLMLADTVTIFVEDYVFLPDGVSSGGAYPITIYSGEYLYGEGQ